MESVTSQSMFEILNECLKESNLETVTKAELRKKYLEKTGLTKLPPEDKKLFTSAVNTAYLNYIGNKNTADTTDDTQINEASDIEVKENGLDWKLTISSSSDDDITPGNIKERIINDQLTNGESIKETSDDEIKENSVHEKLILDATPGDKISHGNTQENAIADQFVNGVHDFKMESPTDLDERPLASHKSNIKKSPLDSTVNGFKKQRGKRILISSSEDETILKPTKKNKVLKKAKKSSDVEAETIVKSEERKNAPRNRKSKNCLKRPILESSDSEDEPLNVYKKKSDSLSGSLNSLTNKSDESENECVSNCLKKQSNNLVDSEDESIMSSTKTKTKIIADSINSNDGKMKIKTELKSNRSQDSLKSKNNSSGSEDEPLTKYRKYNDPIHSDKNSNSVTKKKLNSSNKLSNSIEGTSGSEDEFLTKYSKKKVNNSSDSEDEPLYNFSNEKIRNSSDSEKKRSKKNGVKEVKDSLKKPLKSNNQSKEENSKKRRFVEPDDDSDEQPIAALNKKSDSVNSSLKSMKNSSGSEEEFLDNLSNKKTNKSSDSQKEPVEKIVKWKVKHSLKKPMTSSKRSKEQTLKKRFVDSDDDANIKNQKKLKSFGQRDSLLSDSCEDEPLSNIKKDSNNSSDSDDDDISISNQKKEKSFNKQNSLLSDTSEDEPLSSIKKAKSSSDSEDEPLNKLSIKKSDKKRKNSESGSSSFVDENEEQSGKKNKSSKKKDANDSGKGKKRPSASENKIEHLKKYLRVAGIRISNYNKFFENCKTMKAKCEKMLSLLEKEGLKGRPTLEKCKKLRIKIETKREIAELDMSNILKEGGGRPKRSVCSDTTNCKQEEKSTPIKKFSRLQGIVDSEESD